MKKRLIQSVQFRTEPDAHNTRNVGVLFGDPAVAAKFAQNGITKDDLVLTASLGAIVQPPPMIDGPPDVQPENRLRKFSTMTCYYCHDDAWQ